MNVSILGFPFTFTCGICDRAVRISNFRVRSVFFFRASAQVVAQYVSWFRQAHYFFRVWKFLKNIYIPHGEAILFLYAVFGHPFFAIFHNNIRIPPYFGYFKFFKTQFKLLMCIFLNLFFDCKDK